MLIRGKEVLIGDKMRRNITLEIKTSKIINIFTNYLGQVDYQFAYLSPGFIDNHIHGSGGHDFMEANATAYDAILHSVTKGGATGVMATSITQSQANLMKMIKYASIHQHKFGQAQIYGIHMEGPFISKIKKGAQPETHIIDCDPLLLKQFQKVANGQIKVVTFAPEHDKNHNFVQMCAKLNIKGQIGHTMANEKQINESIAKGAKGVTHVYNAMPKSLLTGTTGFTARSSLYAEIICDGIHNNQEQILSYMELKGKKKMILVTDSLSCAFQPDGQYTLGEAIITKKGLECRLKSNGALAGSVASMIDVVQKAYQFTKYALSDILQMASTNIAKYHNLTNKGSIVCGYDADLVGLDQNLNVKMTMILGKIVYEN